jgi:hypothetical protein
MVLRTNQDAHAGAATIRQGCHPTPASVVVATRAGATLQFLSFYCCLFNNQFVVYHYQLFWLIDLEASY